MLIGLLPLLVLGAIVVLVVRAVGGRDRDDDAGGTAVRRFFQYSLLLTLVIVVAIGAAGLLAEIIPGENIIRRSPEQNARSFAFLLIGGPALYGLTRWIRRDLDTERRSFAWPFYVTVTALTGLITAAISAFEVGEAIVRSSDFNPSALARVIVWSVVWFVHYRLATSDPHQDRMRFHLFGGSLVGLVSVGVALGGAVNWVLTELYTAAFDAAVISEGTGDLRSALVGLAIGGSIWWWYWLRTYSTATRDSVWHVYVLLAGVLAGLVTLLGGVTVVLFTILDWFATGEGSAAAHFEDLPGSLTAIAIGFVVWAYHRAIFRSVAAEGRSEIERTYDYIVAAVGLLSAGAGVATILVAIVQSVFPGDVVTGSDSDGLSTLMGAIALLVVGVPVWWQTWSRVQRVRREDPAGELVSPSRRVYLFALFGAGGVVALVSLLTLAVQALEDVFAGTFGSDTIYDIRISLALVITVGAIAAYHWAIRKEDMADAPPEHEVAVQVRSVVVVTADGVDLAREVADATGVRVRVWSRPDAEAVASVEDVIAAIEAGGHPRLLLVARDGGVERIPYTETG